ncbi:AT-hook motif nuclear-localized protein 9 [Medicago truncatula]|uniref:AT-hook motif nuclear-localized protein n=1 Tax=Medicago truncatula TaxID=3880 RepID=A0A072UJS1_MEDTR|nr:AT-hook motif nuclear-localized protein 9 [Medicago truncatula]KEH29902.1 AT hook motif DNA-binding family protein [Medicago truncatula]
MEDQNLNLPYTLSPSSTQNESETTNNAAIVTEVLGNDAGSDTGAKSKSVGSESAPVKRGRGRPRKYEVGGKPLSPVTPTPGLAIQPCGSEEKRGRGRPRGSGKLQILASIGECAGETAGGSMSPHVLSVNPGEDVVGKIFAFYQNGPSSAVCILSASGTVSTVTLRQPGVSDGFLTYEGHFEILSLNGSCTFTSGAVGGAQRKICMLSVSLAKPNGEVFGGGVENTLIAASPTQLILVTFKQTISNQIKRKHSSLPSTAPNMLTNQDSAKENTSKVPKLTTEGEPSCLTATTTNTNGAIVEDNVTIAADENVQSDSIRCKCIDLESQTPEPVKRSPDINANHVPEI